VTVNPRGSRRAGGADVADAGAEVPDGAAVEVDGPEEKDGSDLPWAGIGVVVLVLVTGAFASGWHLGRRWGRLMGW
jgi:hypothetical protein